MTSRKLSFSDSAIAFQSPTSTAKPPKQKGTSFGNNAGEDYDSDEDLSIYDSYAEMFFEDYLQTKPKRIIKLDKWKKLKPEDLIKMADNYPPDSHNVLQQGESAYDSLSFNGCTKKIQ